MEVLIELQLMPSAIMRRAGTTDDIVGCDDNFWRAVEWNEYLILILSVDSDSLGDEAEELLEVECFAHIIECQNLCVQVDSLINEIRLGWIEALAIYLDHSAKIAECCQHE